MRSPALALLLSAVAWGCGGSKSEGAVAAHRDGVRSPVEVRSQGDHPSLSLVARDGDPFSAIALAVTHDAGAVASLWLEALVEGRLVDGRLLKTDARPSGSGFVLRARAASPRDAQTFMRAVHAAFATPVSPADYARVAERLRRNPQVRTWASPSDAAVGSCTGDLGAPAKTAPPAAAELERLRAAVFTVKRVALAVVGPRPVLAAAEAALAEGDAWPTGGADGDPWPTRDVVGTAPSGDSGHTLSIALRVDDGARAVEAAKALGEGNGPLASHLAVLEPRWTIERVVGTTRARGACLRVDLSRSAGNATLPSVAGVGALVLDEARRALASAPGRAWSLDRGVLEAGDPRDAAAVAAWTTLGGRFEPGKPRLFVNYAGDAEGADRESAAGSGFALAFEKARAERTTPSVETRSAVEPGQGEIWLLLASPCATIDESVRDAGVAALAVRALSHQSTENDGARVEAWASPKGIGLLAHAPRNGPDESAAHAAARVAGALGRAFAATPITDETAATVRSRLESELLPEAQLLWPAAIDALSPRHASLLDPRGTWQSITELSTQSVETERRALLRGPLRLAVLANEAASQTADAQTALERWLRPERTELTRCPATTRVAARPGEYEVDSPKEGGGSRAVVAVSLPSATPEEAEWTVHLLNRPNGWLERSVQVPGLAAHAEALLLGGGDAAAIAIEIVASGNQARDAAAQVRALLARLAEGAATQDDVVAAQAAFADASAEANVDPRHRIVQLWLGRTRARAPDLAALRRFHHDAFASERHVVVVTKTRT